jgi:hypothetical protein
MKTRVTVFAVVLMFAMITPGISKAQFGGDLRMYGGANVGFSVINMLFKSVDYADNAGWKATQIPPIQLSFDYKVTERFSIGLAAAYAMIDIDYTDENILPVANDGLLQNFNANISRINLGIRAFYYYTDNEVVDVYTGFRTGVNIWNIKMSSTDPDLSDNGVDPFSAIGKGAMFGFQIVPIGINVFPVENIGINFELAIGQPYFAAFGVRYRM